MTLPSSHSILLQLALTGLVVHHLDVATLISYCVLDGSLVLHCGGDL